MNRDESGLSGIGMIGLLVSLLITGLLTASMLGSFTSSGGSSSADNFNNAPGVGLAEDLQAKQSLTTSLNSAQSLAATVGGLGSVTASVLGAAGNSIEYTSGPTTSSTTVSAAPAGSSSASTDGSSGAGDGSGFGNGIGTGDGEGGGDGAGSGLGGSGSITLAAWSASGTCWEIWAPAGGISWYGAQIDTKSCTAQPLSVAPTAGAPSSSAVGWQQGSFPTT